MSYPPPPGSYSYPPSGYQSQGGYPPPSGYNYPPQYPPVGYSQPGYHNHHQQAYHASHTYPSGHGAGVGGLLAGTTTAYGAHHVAHGGHRYGHGASYGHGKFKHGTFGKQHGGYGNGKFGNRWK